MGTLEAIERLTPSCCQQNHLEAAVGVNRTGIDS
jgi:hypothetical protein